MDFDILPGPSLPELARTALARAGAATVTSLAGAAGSDAACHVAVRAGRDGSPLLLPAASSVLEDVLASGPAPVIVSVPADSPFRALRLSGAARLADRDPAAGISVCTVDLRAVEFAGTTRQPVSIAEYRSAAPDPLWRVAPGILRHLEHGHMTELVGCVRAHGLRDAAWVIPRDIDRYGLKLHVLTPGGVAAVRLAFPDGPVTSLQDVPASIRTTLTCRCQTRHGNPCAQPGASD